MNDTRSLFTLSNISSAKEKEKWDAPGSTRDSELMNQPNHFLGSFEGDDARPGDDASREDRDHGTLDDLGRGLT
jgi:hypothetical protein